MGSLLMALALSLAFAGLPLLTPERWRSALMLRASQSPRGTVAWWLALSWALGFLAAGTLLLVVGMVGFPPREVLLVATVLLAAITLWRGMRELPIMASRAGEPLHGTLFVALLRIVAVAAVGLLAWMTLQPWLEIDTLTYHQSVPKAWWNEGRIFAVPFEAHSHWHFLSDMVNVWSFALLPSDTIVPKLLELIRSLLAACAAAGGATWLYGRRAGVLTGVMVLLFTEMSRYGTTSHTDVGMGLYATVGVLLLAAWLANPQRLVLLVMGSLVLAGCGAVKQTGAVTVVVGLGVTALVRMAQIIQSDRNVPPSRLLAELAALVLPACIVVAPWMAKNALFTGNPFYPFLSRFFDIHEDAAVPLIHFITYYPDDQTLAERLLPGGAQVAAFNSNIRLNNANGFVFLAFAALLLWFVNRPGDRRVRHQESDPPPVARLAPMLVLAAAAPFFLQAPFFRFHAHLYPLAAMVFVGEVDRFLVRRAAWLPMVAFGVLVAWAGRSFVDYNTHQNFGPRRLESRNAGVTMTPAAVEEYFARLAPAREMVRHINATLGTGDRLLLTFEDSSTPLLDVRFIPNVPCVMQPAIQTMDMLGWDASRMAEYLRWHGVTHLAIEDRYDPGSGHPFVERYLSLEHRDENAGVSLYRFAPDGRM